MYSVVALEVLNATQVTKQMTQRYVSPRYCHTLTLYHKAREIFESNLGSHVGYYYGQFHLQVSMFPGSNSPVIVLPRTGDTKAGGYVSATEGLGSCSILLANWLDASEKGYVNREGKPRTSAQTCPLANNVLPPSIAILRPSTYAPALLTRNNTTPAKSSSIPARLAGTFCTKSPKISAPDPVPIGFILLGTTEFVSNATI